MLPLLSALLYILLLATTGFAAPARHSDPLDLVRRAEPHEVASLLKRAPPNPSDPNFAANYPPAFNPPSVSQIPTLWLDRLRAISLPPCPRSTGGIGLNEYGGQNPGGQAICSFPYGCTAASDLKDPRPGWIGLNFDDGPSGGTDELFDYLVSQNATQRATHFMIGSYIVNNPAQFQKVARGGGHIGVHTWSHRQTTTLSNEEIVGELGWTMQIMSDLNGGRIPKFWRPPYGDVDNRVRAIAKGVFGLETVTWNEDTADWNIGYNRQYTVGSVSASFENLLHGPKTRGLNVLEHEITSACAQVFRNTYPKIAANGWRVGNIAEAFGMDWYQNSVGHGNTDPVASMAVGGLLAVAPPTTISPPATSTSSAARSTSTSPSTSTARAPVNSEVSSATTSRLTSSAFSAAVESAKAPSSSGINSGNRTSAATSVATSHKLFVVLIAVLTIALQGH